MCVCVILLTNSLIFKRLVKTHLFAHGLYDFKYF